VHNSRIGVFADTRIRISVGHMCLLFGVVNCPRHLPQAKSEYKKSASFPTRQWIYVFLPIAKIPLLNIEKSDFDFLVLDSKVENFLISN
jgi:hypothetical protein